MRGADLKGANIMLNCGNEQKLKDLLYETVNIKEAIATQGFKEKYDISGLLTRQREEKSQEKLVIKRVAQTLSEHARDNKDIEFDQYASKIEEITKQLTTLLDPQRYNSPLTQHFFDLMGQEYSCFQENLASGSPKHYSDLEKLQVSQLIQDLYENSLKSPNEQQPANQVIEQALMVQAVADKVGKELFGQGNNRAQDFVTIRKMLTHAVAENPGLLSAIFVKGQGDNYKIPLEINPEYEYVISSFAQTFRLKSVNTVVGLIATGGIQLISDISKDSEFQEDLKSKVEELISDEVRQENALAKDLRATNRRRIVYKRYECSKRI